MKIALDAMGGDLAPQAIIQGAFDAISRSSEDLEIILIGNQDKINSCLDKTLPNQISIHHASEIVTMDDDGSKVFKSKPDSSIVQGLKLVKENKANAFISAGHTGAVMATSLFLLGRIPDVKRPCLGVYIKTQTGGKIICDVGANPDANPEQLLQFAIMASVYLDHVEGIKKPQIGLINIGEESTKGSELYKEAFKLFKTELPNFIGNVESRNLFDCDANVLVCDGFVGNTLIKFAEGWITTFSNLVKEKINNKISYKIGAGLIKPALEEIKNQYDYEEHGGTPLLGVNGIAIVSHGSSTSKAIMNSIFVAQESINQNLIQDISRGIHQHLGAIN
ncbi:MAG: phosphate acyltransferase PlsX [Candidatus Marinimicrobia bacterium]|nr:phosphate acyltransferase PlsX [Candidatus Neomarinimicrobiota bacterium]MBT5096361.1 phosphate acyltransferase PlsX [Candidatus Neomarinimicrobiota bacterium]